MKVVFLSTACVTLWGRYHTGRTALSLSDAITGEPIAKATVNLPQLDPPADDEIDIKNWAENDGMLTALMQAGIIADSTGRELKLGFATAWRYKLTPAAIAERDTARGSKVATYKVK